MKKPVIAAIVVGAAVVTGGVVFAFSGGDDKGRQNSIGDTTTSPGGAGDPAGTLILGPPTTGHGLPGAVIGTTTGSNQLVYKSGGKLYVVPQGSTTPTEYPDMNADSTFPPVGDILISDDGKDNRTFHVIGTTLKGPLDAQQPQTLAVGPKGPLWLVYDAVRKETQVLQYDVKSTGATPLQSVAARVANRQFTNPQLVADGAGVAIIDQGVTPVVGVYVKYSASSTPIQLRFFANGVPGATADCQTITNTYLGCATATTGGSRFVTRVPLSGASPSGAVQTNVDAVLVTNSALFWLVGSPGSYVASMLGSGGTPVASPMQYSSLVANPAGTLFGYSADDERQQDAGVYTAPDLSAPPRKLFGVAAEPYTASRIFASTGHVVWTAASGGVDTTWEKFVAVSNGTITATDSTPLANSVDVGPAGYDISVSGPRTAIGDRGSFSVSDTGVRQTITSTANAAPVISGSRVLYAGGSSLYDLAKKAATDLTSLNMTDGGEIAALWGNYLTYVSSLDQLVYRKDLTSTAAPVKLTTTRGTTKVYAWGDWVVMCTTVCVLKNATSSAAAQQVPKTPSEIIVALTSDGVLTAKYVSTDANEVDQFSYRLLRYTTTSTWTSVALPGVTGRAAWVDNSVVAWIGTDGRPRVAPAPHVANQSRSLGNPVTTVTFPSTGRWLFDLPTSAPLSSCSVQIKSGTTLVRTLPCQPSRLINGSAYVVWDGKNGAGVVQPAGSYTWTVVASNADGALLNADGTTAPTTGTLTK